MISPQESLASSVTIAGTPFVDSAYTLTLGAVMHEAGLHLTLLSLAALSTFGNTISVLPIGDRDREFASDFPALDLAPPVDLVHIQHAYVHALMLSKGVQLWIWSPIN